MCLYKEGERRSLIKKCVIQVEWAGKKRKKGRGERESRRSKGFFFFFLLLFMPPNLKRVGEQSGLGVSCAFWQFRSADGLKGIEWQGSRPFSELQTTGFSKAAELQTQSRNHFMGEHREDSLIHWLALIQEHTNLYRLL